VAEVTPAGLRYDRSFMAVATDGTCRSRRRHPIMAIIHPMVLDDGRRLALSAPGVEDLVIDVASTARARKSRRPTGGQGRRPGFGSE
jgi:uncharacterized protein YcbX